MTRLGLQSLQYFLTIIIALNILIINPVSGADIPTFSNVRSETGLSDIGKLGEPAVWGDYNGDGWQDLLLSNIDRNKVVKRRRSKNSRNQRISARNRRMYSERIESRKLFLFKNEYGVEFDNVSLTSGLPNIKLRAGSWADFDNDGYLDLAVATVGASSPAKLFHNIEGLYFIDISDSAGITGHDSTAKHVIWADYDNDGLVDLFQPSYGISYLYKNNGDGTFEEVSDKAGLAQDMYTNGALWFDSNNDGLLDLFLANGNYNQFYINNGDGTLTDVSEASGLEGAPHWRTTAACAGDYNGDGYFDLYITNIGKARRNALYRNNGDGTFTDVTWETDTDDVGDGRTCAWVDFDADGRVDLFTTNHLPPNKLYHNRSEGSFTDVAQEAGINRPVDIFGATWADYDRDGYIDVFLNGHLGSALMRNNGSTNNSITLRLVGDGITSNRAAIGSRVEVKTGTGVQVREVSGGRGCCEQDMLPVYFGLGDSTEADISIKWPSGKKCDFKNLSVSEVREYTVDEIKCKIQPSEISSK